MEPRLKRGTARSGWSSADGLVADRNARERLFGGSGLTSSPSVIVRPWDMSQVRTLQQRAADALERLRTDVDVWVASADAEGRAFLVPLSFVWHGEAITLSTPRSSRTARNLLRAGWARVGLGPTRDVVMVEGLVEQVPSGRDPAAEQAFVDAAGFDPRADPDYAWLRLTPRTVQAWRTAEELSGRHLMKDGRWLA